MGGNSVRFKTAGSLVQGVLPLIYFMIFTSPLSDGADKVVFIWVAELNVMPVYI